ncbi:hypothetical protein Trydic_g18945 [Trypoxylus dichotomus]
MDTGKLFISWLPTVKLVRKQALFYDISAFQLKLTTDIRTTLYHTLIAHTLISSRTVCLIPMPSKVENLRRPAGGDAIISLTVLKRTYSNGIQILITYILYRVHRMAPDASRSLFSEQKFAIRRDRGGTRTIRLVCREIVGCVQPIGKGQQAKEVTIAISFPEPSRLLRFTSRPISDIAPINPSSDPCVTP